MVLYYEEYKGRNRHNVECFLNVYYISAGQTSLLQVQWKILHRDVFLCSILPEIRKIIDSVNYR